MTTDANKLYRLIRNLHLWAALAMAAGVAMYALSGWFLLHPEWLPDDGSDDTVRVTVAALATTPAPGDLTAPATRQVAAILIDELGLRGRLEQIDRVRDGRRLVFRRPGTEEIVVWAPGTTEIRLRTIARGPRMISNRLHHLHGYSGGPRFWLWAAFLDAVSLSMFVFAGTGVYLWLKTKKDRRLGWALLGGSTILALVAIAHLVLAA